MNNLVSVSILSSDFMNLLEDIKTIEKSGADMLHFDVMDGIFVNNISFGFPILKTVNKNTDMHLDVHLMITDPLRYIEECHIGGADTITFHIESESDPDKTIEAIKKTGAKIGLSVKPNTPFERIKPYMDKIDMLLVMTVEPGFGGQSFMEEMLEKISIARKHITENNLNVDIQVDGGINEHTAKLAAKAGANIMVAGSYLFKAENMGDAVKLLADA